MKLVITGNHTVSYAAKLSRVEVIAAYPITPQTEVVEKLSDMVSNKELNSKFIRVESEHSAMAACIGASATGARAFTATSSQGLALMHEMLHWAANARLPVVMANINRAMAPPWNIWSDQTDSLAQRDTGWLQFYCKDNQEILDTVIQAYKICEKVLLPAIVILDAFILSHTSEAVDVPDQRLVDNFLPSFRPKYKLDVDNPHAFGGLTGPDWYYELRYKIQKAMEEALGVIKDVEKSKKFWKDYWDRIPLETKSAISASFRGLDSVAAPIVTPLAGIQEPSLKITEPPSELSRIQRRVPSIKREIKGVGIPPPSEPSIPQVREFVKPNLTRARNIVEAFEAGNFVPNHAL